MSMVVLGGLIITLTYWALQRTVVPKVQAGQPKKKKSKSHMGMGESFNFLAKSPYIRDLATLVSPQWPAWPACAHLCAFLHMLGASEGFMRLMGFVLPSNAGCVLSTC